MTTVNDLFPSKYLKADDFEEPQTLTMTLVAWEAMKDKQGKSEDKPVLYFKEMEKGLVLNRTNAKIVEGFYGAIVEDWAGKPVTLHAVDVDAFGEVKPAIRIATRKPLSASTAKPAAPAPNSGDVSAFWSRVYGMKLTADQGNAILAENDGNFAAAIKALDGQPA